MSVIPYLHQREGLVVKGIAVDEEANLAWVLAEAVKPHLSTVERHHIYVAIGVGETFAAIGCLIASAAGERIALPADLVERCTRLLDVYAGHEDEQYLRGIVEYVLAPDAIRFGQASNRMTTVSSQAAERIS